MSSTRLLILGAVRIFQPVHGYFVRRELLSWHAEEWAHLNPGSIYNALRTLTREGLSEQVGTETEGRRPARTTYKLTADGRHGVPDATARGAVARRAVRAREPARGVELRLDVQARRGDRRARAPSRADRRRRPGVDFAIEDLGRDPDKPEHVAEHIRLTQARLDGEAEWPRPILERLRGGEYWFAGEPDPPFGTVAAAGSAYPPALV